VGASRRDLNAILTTADEEAKATTGLDETRHTTECDGRDPEGSPATGFNSVPGSGRPEVTCIILKPIAAVDDMSSGKESWE
jgi:hypothetical protein